jgi:Flp pilus assembly pilin Flp
MWSISAVCRVPLSLLCDLAWQEDGQDLIEYTLLLAFVLFTIIGLFSGLGTSVAGIVGITSTNLDAANTAAHP